MLPKLCLPCHALHSLKLSGSCFPATKKSMVLIAVAVLLLQPQRKCFTRSRTCSRGCLMLSAWARLTGGWCMLLDEETNPHLFNAFSNARRLTSHLLSVNSNQVSLKHLALQFYNKKNMILNQITNCQIHAKACIWPGPGPKVWVRRHSNFYSFSFFKFIGTFLFY